MKKALYFDCTCGISGDMALKALMALTENEEAVRQEMEKIVHEHHHHHHHEHEHDEDHDHEKHEHHHHEHTSYKDVQHIINNSSLKGTIKKQALDIYAVIAKAEAQVHASTIEEVGFHEVGRIEAIKNITGIAICMEQLGIDDVYCSPVHDGKGFIECSHGRIPVPVPAVMAMRQDCDYIFVTDEVETEMVTPSGLGVLMGLGARCVSQMPQGNLLKTVEVKGTRDIGKDGGLKVSLIEME
jgi:uncharacterized protein (DUF111 family)